MHIQAKKVPGIPTESNTAFIVNSLDNLPKNFLTNDELNWAKEEYEKRKTRNYTFNRFSYRIFVYVIDNSVEHHLTIEKSRKAGAIWVKELANYHDATTYVTANVDCSEELMAFSEGVILASYKFTDFFTKAEKKENCLCEIFVSHEKICEKDIDELKNTCEANCVARTLVNLPAADLSATDLAQAADKLSKETQIKTTIFGKKEIENLKMGGLLGVNKGSIDPPSFTIMEYKPVSPVNKKPIIFVGKGVVYDTGGLNIKTGTFMENMKSDMGGAAAAICALYAIAKNKLPIYAISLIPSTDNRPGGNAYASGDVLHMYNGSTVEVINTDAEGRLILADALAYAKQYDPELVISLATLTGSAIRAVGNIASAAMTVKADKYYPPLEAAAFDTFERIVRFPMWDEYGKELESEIADIKNLGGPYAGQIHAAKFLAHFTDYPFIHLDIAGPSFTEKPKDYYSAGGTGVGVRLLYNFVNKLYNF
ncbi:MAG: M17 family metallopeptidase [Bacteroidales bacterium]